MRCDDLSEVLIEITVTHSLDETKPERIATAGKAAVEVDLSHLRHAFFAKLGATLLYPDAHSRRL